jgi:hypothetical protein
MVGYQTYSLIYRFVIIHDNQNFYQLFKSTKAQIFLIGFTQAVSIGLAAGFYFLGIIGTEVSRLILKI